MEKREKGRARRWLIRLCSAALVALMVLPVLPNAVVLPASAVTQAEINQMKEDAAALKKQRAELQKQLKAIQADKSKALDQKALLEQQINATQAEINNIAAQITQYDQLIAQKETELAATEEKERAQYELFCKRVREMEEQGEVSYWSILFSSDDFSDLLDNAMMVEEIMDYDNQVMNELIAIREQIEADKTALETARQEQKDAKAEQEAGQGGAEVPAVPGGRPDHGDQRPGEPGEGGGGQAPGGGQRGGRGDPGGGEGTGQPDRQRAQRVGLPVAPARPVQPVLPVREPEASGDRKGQQPHRHRRPRPLWHLHSGVQERRGHHLYLQ